MNFCERRYPSGAFDLADKASDRILFESVFIAVPFLLVVVESSGQFVCSGKVGIAVKFGLGSVHLQFYRDPFTRWD